MSQLHRKALIPLATLRPASTACSSPAFRDETEAYELVTGAAGTTLAPVGNVENLGDGQGYVFARTSDAIERELVF